ncbi:MAG: S8 family serine peptidase [Rhodospirillales bacterium]|nr:S8 family serine peptidase [Rhodospirillales bacterium]
MDGTVRIGLLDSGVESDLSGAIEAELGFRQNAEGSVSDCPACEDRLGHGTEIARIVLARAPTVRLLNAQVFTTSLTTSAAVVAAGLEWLTRQHARLANMSFGMKEDRAVLRDACMKARAAGTILLAASPARGGEVFPASYEGVIRVCGDARCRPGEISALHTAQADFGASPRDADIGGRAPKLGGASFAAAHACGIIARYFDVEPEADRDAVWRHLQRIARYHGPEKRTGGAFAGP